MPKLYLTQTEMADFPLALSPVIRAQLAQLTATQKDAMLFRASGRVDAYCRRRIATPGSTTVASPGVSAGATVIPVPSVLGFDDLPELAVYIGNAGNQELIPVMPGGVQINSGAVAPYPGTITLTRGVAYAHSASEPVVGTWQETYEMGSSNSSDMFDEMITQEAQIAAAHSGGTMQQGALSRTVFLKNYPIISIAMMETAFSYTSAYNTLGGQATAIEPMAGYYNVPLGAPVYEGSYVRTTYTGGYQYMPEVIKNATMWYAADELVLMENPLNLLEVAGNRRRVKYSNGNQGKSAYETKAEGLLKDAGFRRTF